MIYYIENKLNLILFYMYVLTKFILLIQIFFIYIKLLNKNK